MPTKGEFGIGICGYAGAGKDTVADELLDLLSGTFFNQVVYKYAFAQPIYRALAAMFDEDIDSWLDQDKRSQVMFGKHTRRTLMQTLGTEWARECLGYYNKQSLWTKLAEPMLDIYPTIVYNGCRFSDEIEFIRNNYKHPCFILVTRPSTNPPMKHASEQLAGDASWRGTFDIIINNDSTIDDLRKKVRDDFHLWFYLS